MAASVFLSHNRTDKPFARRLAADLKRAGRVVWLDEEKIELGDSIQESIQKGIDESDYLAVVLSPDAVASKWVKQELRQALEREIRVDKITVLPLLYRDCEIPGFLRDKRYADCRTDESYSDALNLLKRRLHLPLTQPVEESERTVEIIVHTLMSLLYQLDSRLDRLASNHPDLGSEFQVLTAISGQACRSVRQHAILQAFSQGTYRLRLDPAIRLDSAIRRILRDYSVLSASSQNIQWRLAGSLGLQRVDESLIDVAFSNLIDNAFKYSYRNTTITVELEQRHDLTVIRIVNTGIAAQSNAADDIFVRGYRGTTAKMVTVNATGIGLYIAKLIIAAHGGEITYDYVPEAERNIFTVRLPKAA